MALLTRAKRIAKNLHEFPNSNSTISPAPAAKKDLEYQKLRILDVPFAAATGLGLHEIA